jgi:hypothetical protein
VGAALTLVAGLVAGAALAWLTAPKAHNASKRTRAREAFGRLGGIHPKLTLKQIGPRLWVVRLGGVRVARVREELLLKPVGSSAMYACVGDRGIVPAGTASRKAGLGDTPLRAARAFFDKADVPYRTRNGAREAFGRLGGLPPKMTLRRRGLENWDVLLGGGRVAQVEPIVDGDAAHAYCAFSDDNALWREQETGSGRTPVEAATNLMENLGLKYRRRNGAKEARGAFSRLGGLPPRLLVTVGPGGWRIKLDGEWVGDVWKTQYFPRNGNALTQRYSASIRPHELQLGLGSTPTKAAIDVLTKEGIAFRVRQ